MREQVAVLLLIVFGYIFMRSLPLKRSFGNYAITFIIFLLLETLLFGVENTVVFERLFLLQVTTFVASGIAYFKFGDFLYVFFEQKDEEKEEDSMKKYIVMFLYIFISLTYNIFFYHFHEIFLKK